MPRITAPTVAEHRAEQRQALIDAALDILVRRGVSAVTPAAVGAQAGLARSSVYQYFPATQALLATVVEAAFPPWNAAIEAALEGVTEPAARIDAYIAATLRLTAEGRHRAAGALLVGELPQACRARLAELHRETARPLTEAVHALGDPDPELTCRLLGGMLQSAMAAVEAGTPAERVHERIRGLVTG